jgi:hypothetical protein
MKLCNLLFCSAMILASAPLVPISGQTVLTSGQASKTLSFENLNMTPPRISGTITNRSPHTIKDIELLIQHHWLWRNERNPGQDSPGRAAFVKLGGQLEPGQSRSFAFTPEHQLPSRNDGQFMTEVDVAAFTVVVSQLAAAR